MAAIASDLDLSRIDSDDYEKLAERINTFYQNDASVKAQLSYHWERNALMLDGKQWIVFDGERETGGLWRKLRVNKQNEYVPRPVTNYLFSSYQTLKSYLLKSKPRISVYPNTNEYRDKNAAKLSTLISDTNWVRLKEQYNYETAASNLICYGTVFKKSYWDTSAKNLIKVPKMETVPVTDPNTGQVMSMQQRPAINPETNEPLFEELPLGDVATYIVDPFRIVLDPLAMHLHEARWIMEYTIQPLDWVRQTYDREGDGYTGLASEVKEERNLNGTMRRWYALRTTSGLKNNNAISADAVAQPDTMIDNACVVKEYYEGPSQDHPKGRLVVVANDKCVYAGDTPYDGPEQGDWHPYSECRWELVPSRFWGKSPLDDAAEIQKQVNSIDSVIILTRKTSAIPQKLIPLTSGIAPGSWTGRPNQEVYYRPDPSGAIPSTIPASEVGESVFIERKQRVDDLKEITGAIDILRGDRPPGVNAATALNLLYEVGTGKLFPILDRWKAFIESDQKKQLRLISKFYKEPRSEFIRSLQAKNTELAPQDISNFIGTDLYDNCNVIVEAGSNIPKLQAAKQGMLVELAQMGLLNLQSPENRIQFQEDLGIQGYDADIGPDKKRAEWENDLLDNLPNSPDNKPLVLANENHQAHIEIHSNRMKQPSFMMQPFEVQKAYMAHIQEHDQQIAMAAQAAMLQNQAMGPSGGPPPGPPQQPPSQPQGAQKPLGKGLSPKMQQAIMGPDVMAGQVSK